MKGSWDSTSIILINFSFFFFFSFGAVFSGPTSKHLCPLEQKDALLEFKNEIKIGECSSIDGIDSHSKTESWKNNSDCCNWEGITCNAELEEVIALNLTRSCLYGRFHSNSSFFVLQNLHFLATLDLSKNDITGPIPSSIGNLSHLTSLILSSNMFLDQLPSSIGKLSRLTTLDISNNKIKGQVPAWLWTLPNLEYLTLSNNTFIGFERSSKHGQSSIRTPSMMKHFFGYNNNFMGKIPSFICALHSLSTLDLSHNNFSGPIHSCMGNLKSTLSDLNLRHNRLSGGLPGDIFESLRSLDVGHNQLVGKLPRSLIRFSSLEVLNIESNKITDTFPFWLSSLKELKGLVLRSNVFHGPIHQTSFPKLRIIDISHNHFSGTLSSEYFSKWIAMSSHEKNEDPEIFTLIDFSVNKFEGKIPRSIGILQELHWLNLSNNAFSGHIPSSMGNLISLEALDVSQNKLSGKIPQELGHLSNLSYMNSLITNLEVLYQGVLLERRLALPLRITWDSLVLLLTKLAEVISWKAVAIGYRLGLVFKFTVGYKLFSHFCSLSFVISSFH